MTSKTTSPSDYQCLDCKEKFEEAEASNASLCDFEFNPACPFCGSDNLKEEDNE